MRLVSVLASRPSWTNRELAEHLSVTERTVRRDVAKLRELGYGIDSDPGPWGGYRLGQGSAVPPLPLDDEETLAVVVALREAALTGVLGGDQAALTALAKLQRLLPNRIAARLEGFTDAVVHTPRVALEPVSATVLLSLAGACRAGDNLRLSYRDRLGRESVREVSPYRLVRTRNRWYLVAFDMSRSDWRIFRADRVVEAHRTGRPAVITDPPDAGRLVSEMLISDYPVYARVRIPAGLDEARRLVPPGAGLHEPDGADATVITLGGVDLDELAVRLIRLGTPLRVLEPVELNDVLRMRLRDLLD
ncbi:putative DNA-binding transcriptional regulator YafY [Kutzneria buriramensis]|uniref:Putative DNA-binding transcriptional regulator YafY n=2 Tax=Kutzneria buriramensis TaxID=1045776 RepID=A0A3E0HF32_9PSEU|nr:putative DNA-binding transcriptional regulator YafY [Kutzneria buriramensis]